MDYKDLNDKTDEELLKLVYQDGYKTAHYEYYTPIDSYNIQLFPILRMTYLYENHEEIIASKSIDGYIDSKLYNFLTEEKGKKDWEFGEIWFNGYNQYLNEKTEQLNYEYKKEKALNVLDKIFKDNIPLWLNDYTKEEILDFFDDDIMEIPILKATQLTLIEKDLINSLALLITENEREKEETKEYLHSLLETY